MAQLTNNTDFSVLKYSNNNSSNNINKAPIKKEMLQHNNDTEMVQLTDTGTGHTEIAELKDYPSDFELKYANILYKDGFMAQGFTYAGDKVIISAYDVTGAAGDSVVGFIDILSQGLITTLKNTYKAVTGKDIDNIRRNSRLYVFDLNNPDNYYTVLLDGEAHSGGCSYDEKDKLLFVTGSDGAVNVYKFNEMNQKAEILKNENNNNNVTFDLTADGNESIRLKSYININDGKTTNDKASTVYIDSQTNKVYIGHFTGNKEKAYVVEGTLVYDKESNTCKLVDRKEVQLDTGIQGIATFHYGGKTYLVESRSYFLQSVITVRDITNGLDNSKVIGSIKKEGGMPSEGIDINSDGIATITYEGLAFKTSNLDIKEIIKENNGQVFAIDPLDDTPPDPEPQPPPQ